MAKELSFAGKVAIVTGGSSGIGRSVAEALGSAGATIAVVASSNQEKARQVADGIEESGGSAAPFVVDVRDDRAVRALVAKVEESFGGIDCLVNAAGVFFPTPVGKTEVQSLDQIVDINIKGTWTCINATVPALRRRGGGKILNFASVAGLVGINGFALYSATKAAIVMMTRSLAAELAPDGININAIAPGNTATPMNLGVRTNEEAVEAMRKVTPSGNAFSDASDIAAIALFLLSQTARPVHGATWLADEGISAAIG